MRVYSVGTLVVLELQGSIACSCQCSEHGNAGIFFDVQQTFLLSLLITLPCILAISAFAPLLPSDHFSSKVFER